MHRVECRIEPVPLGSEEPRLLQLVERLAELGRPGWLVASVDLTAHASYEVDGQAVPPADGRVV
jgi:hypothetical protein